MSELTDFRQQIDASMRHPTQSPLEDEQRAAFTGLSYYEENDALVFEVEVERFPATEPMVEMETSTGEIRPYRRWGRFAFTVDGQVASLTVFSDGYGFFLPFKDSSNGRETYGAGRYLDDHRPGIERLSENKLRIDFNYGYNPYCAYSAYFSCPLPPRENWLQLPIRAGEKKFE